MQKQLCTLLLLLSTVWLTLNSQTIAQLAAGSKHLDAIEKLQLPALDNETLLQAEMARRGPGIAPRFAESMIVDVSPETHGTWTYRSGRAIWRLRVPSPGAKSLNFGFDKYVMPPGGKLMLFSADLKQIQGPFTPADNEEHAELWTPVVSGDDIIIEVSVPEGSEQELELHLKSVNHDFLGFSDVASSILSGSCNLDVVCGSEDGWSIVDQYRDIIQSVAVYGQGGTTFCTGFLVNNAREDCTPFFMTADHCGIGPGNAASLVVYWNYMNSECRQPGSVESGQNGDGSLADFNTGSVFRAAYSPSDMVLVELDDPVSETADAFFAGWDAREVLEQDTIIAVHHPSTDEKRISFEFDGVYRGAWGQGSTPVANGNHLVIADWDIGTTEGGSSGSPIFDSDKRVVGQLHGGQAACGNNAYDSYGWFATSWVGGGTASSRLQDWLDPDNTGILTLDGRAQIRCSFFALAEPAAQTLCAPETATYDISVSENFVSTVTLSIPNLPAGLTVVFDDDTVAPGGTTQMTITGTENLAAGTYSFNLMGTDGNENSDQVLTLNIFASAPLAPALMTPADAAMGQQTTLLLDWAETLFAEAYDIELATDPAFSNVVASASDLSETSFFVPNLEILTTYYWRVRASNPCGDGSWSDSFEFTTEDQACGFVAADTDGQAIGPNNGAVTSSELVITQTGEIAAIKLTGLSTDHTWVGDLSATLTSPGGITINLFNRPDCPEPGMLVDFSDDASATADDFVNACNAGGGASIQGEFQPVQPFANFMGQEASGTWTLAIRDNANFDGGSLLGWNLEICTEVTSEVTLASSTSNLEACIGVDASLELSIGAGFTTDVTLDVEGLPMGALVNYESNPVDPGSTVNVNITDLTAAGSYVVTFTATDGFQDATVNVMLEVQSPPSLSAPQSPANNAEIMGGNAVNFSWAAVADADEYRLQIATDDNFSNIIVDDVTTLTSASNTLPEGQYYWRVVSSNECGDSVTGFRAFTVTSPNATVEIAGASIEIWPNPTTGPLRITLSQDIQSDLMVTLLSINGQLLKRNVVSPQAGTTTLDLGDLPSGVYLLQLQHEGARKAVRIVRQ